jgi:hypothetical protein
LSRKYLYSGYEKVSVSNDQTVYIDRDDFDGFSFLDASVNENQMILDIDESLIRKGAVIYLLCELNDMVGEFEEDYLSQEYTKKVISSLSNRERKSIPEVDSIVSMVIAGENTLNYPEYNARLEEIYKNMFTLVLRVFCYNSALTRRSYETLASLRAPQLKRYA